MDGVKRNMTVLFILVGNEMGGAERQALFLAKGLQKKKHIVRFICLAKKKGKIADLLDENGIDYYILDHKAFGFICRFVFLINKNRPDVLMPYTFHANVLIGFLKPILKTKVSIWNQRNIRGPQDFGLSVFRKIIYNIAVKNPFDIYISNSQGGALVLEDQFHIPRDKIAVIYNGVELKPPMVTRSVWRSENGFSDEDILFCMVANLTVVKDHPILLKAWQIVCKKINISTFGIYLLLAGRDDRNGFLQQQAEELGIKDSVVFMGPVDDVNSLLHSVSVSVFVSNHEGTPNAVLESMAAGLPVIATDIPNVRFALADENHALLFPCGDFNTLAEKIIFSIQNYVKCFEIGEKNKKRIENFFYMEKMLSSFEDVMKHLLMEKK